MSPRALLIAALAAVVLTLGEARAQTLRASLERNPIYDDETVRLIVEADVETNGAQPDFTPLQRDFEILGQSTNTQIAINNGARSIRTQWIIELAPRRTGRIAIEALRMGGMASASHVLEVLPAASSGTGRSARNVFLEVQVTPQDVYVQSQITYALRIYRAAEFLEAKLSDFKLGDAVTRRLGNDTTYTKSIDGRSYRVIERRFAIFPQASGRFTLPAIRLDARIADTGAATNRPFGKGRRTRTASQPVDIVVKPRPDAAATPWLPARAVNLSEKWPENPPRLIAGEPVIWTLRLEAVGLTGEQLPPLDIPDLDGARSYPDQPSIETRTDQNAVYGTRIQRIAVAPGAAGELKIPELRVHWWDIEADAPRTALIPARTVTVAAAPINGETPVFTLDTAPAAPEPGQRLWQVTSTALAVAWLATLAVLLRVLGKLRRGSLAPPSAAGELPPSTAAARRRVLDACRGPCPRAARDALLDWAGSAWPESPPRGLIAFAARVRDEPFAAAIVALDRVLWSDQDTNWTGQSLAALLPRELGSAPRRGAAPGALPSLHPA